MVRFSWAALLLAGLAVPAPAALQPDDEPLTRCGVDFDVAYALLVPEPGAGQTEAQALASLPPDIAKLATAMQGWSKQAHDKMALATHLTSEDSRQLAVAEKAEEDQWVDRLNGAKTEADQNTAFDALMVRTNDCAHRFFPQS
jgi:hypothetical protein